MRSNIYYYMNMLKYLVALAAFLVAGCAAFFSVKGIAMLFSGAFIATVIMAGALEFGKLVSVSFLHRHWNKIGNWLKGYLTTAVIILMFVTSLGIFGFLSSAYQDSALKHEVHLSQIQNIEDRKKGVIVEIESVNQRIMSLTDARKGQENRLDGITKQIGVSMTARSAQALQESTQKLIEQSSTDISKAQDKLDTLNERKTEFDEEVLSLKINNTGSKDMQTFEFVAKEFDMTLDSVAKWFILIIIFVFDPLAVALVLAYNTLIMQDEPEEEEEDIEIEVENAEKEKRRLKFKSIKTRDGSISDPEGNLIADSDK